MSFDPYIHFQGNCAEAMKFYAEVFGGELQMFPYSATPDASPDMAASELVMHASLVTGGRVLMAGDFPPGMAGDPQKAFSVSHTVPDLATGQALFDRLAEGGTVIMPMGPTFWTLCFGMLKDRFGTHWMLNGPPQPGMA